MNACAKQGNNNPMFGKRKPCTDERKLAVLKGKNLPNYAIYKTAIIEMDFGKSANTVSKELKIGRGICFNLKE